MACPNDPDDVKTLSEVAGAKIDEVFIGSCMTNIGHFRAAAKLLEGKRDLPTRLWVAPPTKMDASELTKEGVYGTFGATGARMEMPGCSLCMGNRAQIREGSTAMSTSTRNFPNRRAATPTCTWVRRSWPRSARVWAASRPRRSTWRTSA